jgi:diacylglycerol kinase family enzyme
LCVIHQHAVDSDELLRVHIMGGTGTLSEAVNAVINLPNVQIAAYPFGNGNCFLQYFGTDVVHLFSSIRSQVFSSTTPVDVIKCGHMYGISHGLVGLEAEVSRTGYELYESSTFINQDLANILAAVRTAFGNRRHGQKYFVTIDGERMDGTYASILIANGPCYSKNMSPAVDAHPNDGLLDIYLIKKVPRLKSLFVIWQYISGNYMKFPEYITHHRGTSIRLSSESIMDLAIDDKPIYDSAINFEILPYAVDLVCPGGIDVEKLPRLYKRSQ